MAVNPPLLLPVALGNFVFTVNISLQRSQCSKGHHCNIFFPFVNCNGAAAKSRDSHRAWLAQPTRAAGYLTL
ncbi:hypothetical protein SUGI_0999880 [Cryptomeria japonica]|nr:hypothetical protein SUGI_0999880 [Cryptomeria japonica]